MARDHDVALDTLHLFSNLAQVVTKTMMWNNIVDNSSSIKNLIVGSNHVLSHLLSNRNHDLVRSLRLLKPQKKNFTVTLFLNLGNCIYFWYIGQFHHNTCFCCPLVTMNASMYYSIIVVHYILELKCTIRDGAKILTQGGGRNLII